MVTDTPILGEITQVHRTDANRIVYRVWNGQAWVRFDDPSLHQWLETNFEERTREEIIAYYLAPDREADIVVSSRPPTENRPMPSTSFILIDATARTTRLIACETLKEAQLLAMGDVQVDHGIAAKHVGIVVYEYGLFEPVEHQHYFSIGGHLYAGNAVLYGFDARGETVDVDPAIIDHVVFYADQQAIEAAISAQKIKRPQMTSGKTMWSWPDPAPAGVAAILRFRSS